jgi:hypothetical protein
MRKPTRQRRLDFQSWQLCVADASFVINVLEKDLAQADIWRRLDVQKLLML